MFARGLQGVDMQQNIQHRFLPEHCQFFPKMLTNSSIKHEHARVLEKLALSLSCQLFVEIKQL